MNCGEPFAEAQQLQLEDEVVAGVMASVGIEGLSWQSHELIEQLFAFYLQTGNFDWEQDFENLLSLSLQDGVSDYSVERVASRVAQLGGPRSLETSVANSYLRYRWPGSDGLVPSAPFRFLHRTLKAESIFGRDGSVDRVGDQVLREVEWVSSSLVVSGALDGVHQLSPSQAQQRWLLLRSRVQGFLEAQQQPPQVVWEITAAPRPGSGQLFVDPQHLESHQQFILDCCGERQAMPLQIRVPLPIPASTRQFLSLCLGENWSPRIVWEQQREPSIVAGRLHSLPSQGIQAICQRMSAFDRIVTDGMGPCWEGDWMRARQQLNPLWVASEKTIPPECVQYLQRNTDQLQPFPVIAIEPAAVGRSRKDLKKLLKKMSRRRGGGWDRLEELLRETAIFPRLLAPIRDRA